MSTDFFPTQLRFQTSHSRSVIVHILLLLSLCPAAVPLPSDMHSWALATIESVYKEDFKQAEEEARRIIRKYPDHPAGYFFMAVALDSWMSHYQSSKKENEFYNYCDLAIERGEKLLDKEKKNEWARFFMGGADGYKGTYEARYERWITAFRYGWKGVSQLMHLAEAKSSIPDINYGIGSYEYWRSALMKVLWWMPGIEDKRESGIQKLMTARKSGVYTRGAASASLISILLNENRAQEACDIADEMLAVYPKALIFLWGKGRALYELGRYTEAEALFKGILGRVESESFDNHFNGAICHLWLAKINLQLGRYTQSIAECNRMKHYEYSDDIRQRLQKPFSEADDVRKAATGSRSRLAKAAGR